MDEIELLSPYLAAKECFGEDVYLGATPALQEN